MGMGSGSGFIDCDDKPYREKSFNDLVYGTESSCLYSEKPTSELMYGTESSCLYSEKPTSELMYGTESSRSYDSSKLEKDVD
jgi:hypothetical protein